MQYKCLQRETYRYENYQLVTIRLQDMLLIKKWRNEQIAVLRQDGILTDEAQVKYFNNVILPSYDLPHPTLILFSFIVNGCCIGYGGLTNVDWKSKKAEISFLLDTERIKNSEQYNLDFQAFLHIIKQVAFEDLNLHRLFTETYDIRPAHIMILEKSGFQLEGRLKEHILEDGQYVDSLIHGYLKGYYNVEK